VVSVVCIGLLQCLVPVRRSVSRLRHAAQSPLFPYTTLFRSQVFAQARRRRDAARVDVEGVVQDADDALEELVLGHFPGTRTAARDRKSTRLNSSHVKISYAVFCLKKKRRTRKKSNYDLKTKV